MKENVIQVLGITGMPIACYQVESINSLENLYKNRLLRITQTGLRIYDHKPNSKNDQLQHYRFVVAKDQKQKQILLKVQPIKCFLHYNDTNTKVIKINPYQSVRWLKNLVQQQRKTPVKLTVNNVDLSGQGDSLLKFIFQNAIIHVNQLKQPQKIIKSLKIKEPGAEQKVYTLQNVQSSMKIDQLIIKISDVLKIPYQFLHIVYGGKILSKDKLISQYNIVGQNNNIIAVDSRKYMKKMPLKEFQKRQQQVKEMKQNNKQILTKLKQQIQKQKKQKQSPTKSKGSPQRNRLQYLMEKSGGIGKQYKQDDTKYFVQPKMSIESQQYQQFQRLNKFEQGQRNQQGNIGNRGTDQPALNRLNSELKHGRIVTNQQQCYEDEQGYIHQYKKQKKIFRNGQNIVYTDIAEDKQGNIIQIQKDIVNMRRDSTTGYVTKVQTDIIENANHVKTIITKQQVRDPQGNIVRYEQSRVTQNDEQEGQGVVSLQHHEPKLNEHREISVDNTGNIHIREQQIVESQQKTIFINKDTIQNSEGDLLVVRTNVVQIEGNDDGNVHKHKTQITQQANKVTLVETFQVIDLDGQRISKQNDTIVIENRDDGTVVRKQTDVIQENGETKIIQKGIIQDEYGNVIKSQTRVVNIEQDQYSINIHQKQEIVEEDQSQNNDQEVGQFKKQINVAQDDQGNKITVEKQLIEDQSGRGMVVHRYIVENSQGDIVRQKTQTVQVNSQSQNLQIQRHIVDYTQQEGKATIVQKTYTQDEYGSVIKSQKQTIQIQQLEDGTIRKIETDVVNQEGRKYIYARNQIQDHRGKILSKTSDMIQISTLGPQNAIQNQQYSQGNNFQVTKLNRRYNYDEQGNAYVVETQIINSQGSEKVIQRQYLFNQRGNPVITQTGITQKRQAQDGTLILTATDIVQQNGEVTVSQSSRVVDNDGIQIRRESGTLHINQSDDGLTHKQKQTLVQQNGVKVKVNKQSYLDEQGNVLQEKCMTTKMNIDSEGNSQVVQKYTKKQQQVSQDQQGNYHLVQREVTDDQNGKLTILETQVVRDQQNQLLQATTDVVQLKHLDDGSIRRHQVNIIQKTGKVTIAVSDSLQNEYGQKLQGQVQSVVLKQGANDSIIRQQTNLIVQDQIKVITQSRVIQDSEGNVISQKQKTKKICTDEDGQQRQRQVQSYQIDIVEVNAQPQIIQRQVIQDERGNIHTIQTEIIQNENSSTVIESETVKSPSGQLLEINKIVTQTQELQSGTISVQNKQTYRNDKVITSETVTIQNTEGNIVSQNQKRVQITEDDGLIRKSQYDIVRQPGRTFVDVVNTLQDQEGNVVDRSQNVIKIRDTQQAVREHARKIARAELDGQITAVIKRKQEDKQGLIHFIQKQVIDDHGNRITVDTQTIRTPTGQIVKTVTGITEQKVQDGQLRNMRTQITEQDGQVKVVEYQSAGNKQYDQGERDQYDQGQNMLQGSHRLNNNIKLKFTDSIDISTPKYRQSQAQEESAKKSVKFLPNQFDIQEQNVSGLSGAGEAFINKYDSSVKQLPIYSKKILEQPSSYSSQQVKYSNYHYQHHEEEQNRNISQQQAQYQIPSQYYITLIDKHRNQTRLKICFDDIIDEVAEKLSAVINKPKDDLKFYKDGNELEQFNIVSELNILPNTVLYYMDQGE